MRANSAVLALLSALAFQITRCSSQTSTTANEVSATSTGATILNGFTLIETDSSGRASHSTNTSSGSLSTLSPGGAAYSPFVSGAACIFVGFSSNFSTVDALLVTKSNLQTMLSGGTLDYSKAQPLPAGSWKASRYDSAVLATNTTESYVFVIINTGGQAQNGSLNSPTQVGFRIAAYSSTSSVCTSADNGSSSSSVQDSNLVPYFEEGRSLDSKETRPFVVVDSATCISFQVLAQASQNISSLDLLFFVDVISSSESWITNKYPLPVPHLGAVCQQSLNGLGGGSAFVEVNSTAASPAVTNATISSKQHCQVNVDELDPTLQYVIWGISGERQSSASGAASNAFVRYAAKGQGSCAGVVFPDPSNEVYFSSPSTVVGAINTPAPLASPPSGGSPSPLTGQSTPVGTSSAPIAAPPSPSLGPASSGGGSTAPGPSNDVNGCRAELRASYEGTLLANVTSNSTADCAKSCGAFNGCNVFVYCPTVSGCDSGNGNTVPSNLCALKSAMLSLGVGVPAYSRGNTTFTSGVCAASPPLAPPPLPPPPPPPAPPPLSALSPSPASASTIAKAPMNSQIRPDSPASSAPSSGGITNSAPGPASPPYTNFVPTIGNTLAAAKLGQTTCQSDSGVAARIAGPSYTTTSVYPYMVSLRSPEAATGGSNTPAHYCGGTLLFDRVIMTAAHCCLDNKTSDTWVPQYASFGGSDLTTIQNPPTAVIGATCLTDEGADSQLISSAIVHPQWDGDFKDAYDICLMFTDKPFNASKSDLQATNGKPIGSVFPTLPRNASWTSQNKAGINYNLQTIGWGQFDASGKPSLQLKNASLTYTSYANCAKIIQPDSGKVPFRENQFCAASDVAATCQGDSGGPLLYSPSGGADPSTDIILGIVSYGPGGNCQTDNSWTVFTDVLAFNSNFNQTCAPDITKKDSTADNWISCTLSRRNFNVSALTPAGDPSVQGA